MTKVAKVKGGGKAEDCILAQVRNKKVGSSIGGWEKEERKKKSGVLATDSPPSPKCIKRKGVGSRIKQSLNRRMKVCFM